MILAFITPPWGYRFQEQDLLAMQGQERSLHECPQFTWGEQYVLGDLGQVAENLGHENLNFSDIKWHQVTEFW